MATFQKALSILTNMRPFLQSESGRSVDRMRDFVRRFINEDGSLKEGTQALLDHLPRMLKIALAVHGNPGAKDILLRVIEMLPAMVEEERVAILHRKWTTFRDRTAVRHTNALRDRFGGPRFNDWRNRDKDGSTTVGDDNVYSDEDFLRLHGVPPISNPEDIWGENHGFTHVYLVDPRVTFGDLSRHATVGYWTGDDMMGGGNFFTPLFDEERFPARQSDLNLPATPYWMFVRFVEIDDGHSPQSLQRTLQGCETGLTLREGMFLRLGGTPFHLMRVCPSNTGELQSHITQLPLLLLEAWKDDHCLVLTGEDPPNGSMDDSDVGFNRIPSDFLFEGENPQLVVRGIYPSEREMH